MKRTTYLAITLGIVLCLAVVFNYGGAGSNQGAEGTGLLSCSKLSVGPEVDAKIAPATESDSQGNTEAAVQLLIGDVKYSDSIGSDRWRATFSVKLLLPSGKNAVETSEIEFYHKTQRVRPLKYEEGWIHISRDDKNFDRGLLSYEGEWRDSQESQASQEPMWLMVHVINPTYGVDTRLVTECDFSEESERPVEVWDREQHLRYEPESDTVLESESVDYRQAN